MGETDGPWRAMAKSRVRYLLHVYVEKYISRYEYLGTCTPHYNQPMFCHRLERGHDCIKDECARCHAIFLPRDSAV